MRVLKSFSSIAFITAIALFYVHQQVELVKVSYAIECKERKIKEMLDQRQRLGYNINNLQAPSRMEQVLASKHVEIMFPRRANIVTVASLKSRAANEEHLRTLGHEKRLSLLGFFDFLSQSREAQAREK